LYQHLHAHPDVNVVNKTNWCFEGSMFHHRIAEAKLISGFHGKKFAPGVKTWTHLKNYLLLHLEDEFPPHKTNCWVNGNSHQIATSLYVVILVTVNAASSIYTLLPRRIYPAKLVQC
jgi:hypothetical protein